VTRLHTHRASRRSVLGSVLLVATTAGCSVEPSREDPPAGGTTPTAADQQPAPADDPDARLVRGVVDDLTAALALVGGVARAGRPLAREVAPWRELHAAHLEALDAPGRARPLRVRGGTSALRTRVRRRESTLQTRLADAAVSARSGPLAALLATMSAAVAQQLAADSTGARR